MIVYKINKNVRRVLALLEGNGVRWSNGDKATDIVPMKGYLYVSRNRIQYSPTLVVIR